ncbi:hydroxymethylglutaryl-CoA synthase family protein [Paenibacillus hexagrammi]|uniref:Hydroxymethylglutaryl-CoA synthase family protein n=1 Tax=Paenibacillus hexagrammi TaxID=2908839 RepID=A0ABY3SM23_9BACL|nr:hydroxymethylglutaryl-CoA synthase family protein [Paenibacillus sp. YPD9-1]UJF34774.1 hydroxymethylglutaryl-CoA synthase family protein [Paenibacillus sp. YPD9-1]
MISVGIEAMNVFGGIAFLDVMQLAKHRNMDTSRFENLLIKEKTVAMPYEDPITYGVNAAKPLIDLLSDTDKDRIELLITCTESGVDFGKSISTYIHHYLGLNRNCRLFEMKNACYSGTAGLQMAVNFILSQTSPGAKALVVVTDISRFTLAESGDVLNMDWAFAEPTSGAGAAAILVSDTPYVFQVDVGANGYYGYEVMDTCRPTPDGEVGDADLGFMSYLDCCERSFLEYQNRVNDVNYRDTFEYLSFHTPFGGMVKSAHRAMMRKMAQASPREIEPDFQKRVAPGLIYCQRVGNMMGGSMFMSLASTIDHGSYDLPKRIGCFSYGSGCCSEFYSGIASARGQQLQSRFRIEEQLNGRYSLNIQEYEALLAESSAVKFGTRNTKLEFDRIPAVMDSCKGKGLLFLQEIKEFHRQYSWI